MIKGIKKNLILIVALALVFSCAFALPCSAKQTITFNPVNLTNLNADYEKGAYIDGSYYLVDEGTQTLSYNGMILLGGLVYYKYSNAPFNVGSPTYSGNNGQSYSVAVDVGNLNMQIPYSTSSYVVRTRIAIGNGTSILSMTPKLDVSLYSSSDLLIKQLNYNVKGNVAYVEDVISSAEMIGGNVSIRITFYFGDAWGVTSVPWSNSTYLYLSPIVWERADDLSDVLNHTTDKNNQANSNAENELNDIQSEEDDLINQMDNVFNQLPDISLFENEVIGVTTTGSIMLAVFNGFGDKFIHLWWILSTIGILATFIGLLIKRKKE